MQGVVRAKLNTEISARIAQSKASNPCKTHTFEGDDPSYIVWANSSILHMFNELVATVGPAGLNAAIDCVTNSTGAVSFTIPLPPLPTPRAFSYTQYTETTEHTDTDTEHVGVDSYATHGQIDTGTDTGTVLTIQLSGLSSFYALEILQPLPALSLTPYNLLSEIALGVCKEGGASTPLQVTISSSSSNSSSSPLLPPSPLLRLLPLLLPLIPLSTSSMADPWHLSLSICNLSLTMDLQV